MRKEFYETTKRSEAVESCPWASKIVKVIGGYMCFESIDDFNIWKNQK